MGKNVCSSLSELQMEENFWMPKPPPEVSSAFAIEWED